MADSFFGFNTSLPGLELDDGPDLDEEEEEYDALNNETFGADAFQGDWEEDHTRFAEVTENSRIYRNSFNSERDDEDLDLETSLSQLVLDEGEDEDEEYLDDRRIKHKTSKPIKIPDGFSLDCAGDYSSSPAWSIDSPKKEQMFLRRQQQSMQIPLPRPSTQFLPPQIPRIPTVQELEREIMEKSKTSKLVDKEIKSSNFNQILNHDRNQYQNVHQHQNANLQQLNSNMQQQQQHHQNINIQHQNANIQQQQNAKSKFTHSTGSNKFPPGFGPHQRGHFPKPPQQEMVLLRNNQNMPMMLGPPRLLPPHILPPHPILLAQNARLVAPHPMMRFMPTHPLLMQQQQQQHHHQQQQMHQKQNQFRQGQQNHQDNMRNGQVRSNHNSNHMNHPWMHNPNRRGGGDFDEYAGLMNNKERQWLLNIQIIQLATDKPHVDDYYYMVWKKKQEKEKKAKEENRNGMKRDKPNREPFFANNRKPENEGNHRERRDSERDMTATPSPRVYVPLQFENSLGRLQCGSVTAPRKIIDLDVVSEPQTEVAPLTSHKDSRKTKKILLELERIYLLVMDIEDIDNDLIPEKKAENQKAGDEKDEDQKAEEPEEPKLTKPELVEKAITSFLNEDRFVYFMYIRKGKTLLLRILSHLNNTEHKQHLSELWCRLFKSFPTIVRRDQNDGLLIQMYPYFKKWISTVDYMNLSLVASQFLPGNVSNQGKNSSRAVSPSSAKSGLSSTLTNRFGVSAVSSILSHGEAIYPTLEEKEKLDWTNFIFNFIKHMTNLPNLENIPTPLDPLPTNVLTVILNRSTVLHIQDYASAKRVLTAFHQDKSRS